MIPIRYLVQIAWTRVSATPANFSADQRQIAFPWPESRIDRSLRDAVRVARGPRLDSPANGQNVQEGRRGTSPAIAIEAIVIDAAPQRPPGWPKCSAEP